MELNGGGAFSTLSCELIYHTSCYLADEELCELAKVSSEIYAYTSDNLFWKRRVQRLGVELAADQEGAKERYFLFMQNYCKFWTSWLKETKDLLFPHQKNYNIQPPQKYNAAIASVSQSVFAKKKAVDDFLKIYGADCRAQQILGQQALRAPLQEKGDHRQILAQMEVAVLGGLIPNEEMVSLALRNQWPAAVLSFLMSKGATPFTAAHHAMVDPLSYNSDCVQLLMAAVNEKGSLEQRRAIIEKALQKMSDFPSFSLMAAEIFLSKQENFGLILDALLKAYKTPYPLAKEVPQISLEKRSSRLLITLKILNRIAQLAKSAVGIRLPVFDEIIKIEASSLQSRQPLQGDQKKEREEGRESRLAAHLMRLSLSPSIFLDRDGEKGQDVEIKSEEIVEEMEEFYGHFPSIQWDFAHF